MTHPPEAILDRLHGLHPRLIDLSLDRLRALLAKLDNPQHALPPVIHVAGTNGKGSTCAFLRAMAEAAGLRVHVYTSPHLVRFNERIRRAGTLVDDATLSAALNEVEQTNAGAPITVFEVITAAALLLFARTQADLVVLEVGLGGRGDATNVIDRPAACAIASISLDHQDLLGDTIAAIAAEKAGIIKPTVPVVTGHQPPEALAVLTQTAATHHAPLLRRGRDWHITPTRYTDAHGTIDLPPLALPGAHQHDNAGLAIAALRAAHLPITAAAFARGAATAIWPARLQQLHGALASLLPPTWQLWLDGGHNEGAATILADQLTAWSDRPVHLLIGMKQTKNPATFLARLLPHATTAWAVAEPAQHLALPIETLIAAAPTLHPGPDLRGALTQLAGPPAPGPVSRVLICGSLHLAGEALKLDGTLPQ
jgi:dihydrofolate synthase/folylpolyglutamate synthase